jgi:transcriptional regulator with XRE-family HTH domain
MPLLRLRLGVTQATIARALGIGQGRVSRFEGCGQPRIDSLQRYAHALGGRLRVYVVVAGESFELEVSGHVGPTARADAGRRGQMISWGRTKKEEDGETTSKEQQGPSVKNVVEGV